MPLSCPGTQGTAGGVNAFSEELERPASQERLLTVNSISLVEEPLAMAPPGGVRGRTAASAGRSISFPQTYPRWGRGDNMDSTGLAKWGD